MCSFSTLKALVRDTTSARLLTHNKCITMAHNFICSSTNGIVWVWSEWIIRVKALSAFLSWWQMGKNSKTTAYYQPLVCVCFCVYVYARVHVHCMTTYTGTYTYMQIHTHTQTHTCTNMHSHTCICVDRGLGQFNFLFNSSPHYYLFLR